MQTVYEAFTASAARRPDADFLYTDAVTAEVYGIVAGPTTWADAARQVERLRAASASLAMIEVG